jgi:hypothetical protein
MNFNVTWTPCADTAPARLLCPYFGVQSDGITSVTIRRETMAGGIIVDSQSTIESIQSSTLISIDPGSMTALPFFPTGSSIYISFASALQTVSFPNLVSIGESLVISYCALLTSVNFNSLATLDGWVSDPTPGSTFLQFLISNNDLLTSLSFPSLVGWSDISMSAYTEFAISDNPLLTSLSIPAFVPNNTIIVDCRNNALDQTSVDLVLARCVANPAYVSGWVRLNGGTNSAPSVAGLADVATLVGRGVTVAHN